MTTTTDSLPTFLPTPMLDLTDEEVAALAGPGSTLVALPYLDTLKGEARDAAIHTAYRSMVARNMLQPPTPEQARAATESARRSGRAVGEYDVQLPEQLSALLEVREGAPVVLCVQRTVQDETLLRYAHIVDALVLVEDVLATGLHRFATLDRAELARCVQSFLIPDDAADGSGTGFAISAEAAAAGRATPDELGVLGEAHVIADVVVRHLGESGPGLMTGVFAGPRGTHVTRNEFGSGGALELEPVPAASVGELVDALVVEAEAAVRAEPPPPEPPTPRRTMAA